MDLPALPSMQVLILRPSSTLDLQALEGRIVLVEVTWSDAEPDRPEQADAEAEGGLPRQAAAVIAPVQAASASAVPGIFRSRSASSSRRRRSPNSKCGDMDELIAFATAAVNRG